MVVHGIGLKPVVGVVDQQGANYSGAIFFLLKHSYTVKITITLKDALLEKYVFWKVVYSHL